jgi:hypothetical protein
MVFQTLQAKDEPFDFSRFATETALRRASYEATQGPIAIPRNSGRNRSAAKLSLLAQLEAVGANW